MLVLSASDHYTGLRPLHEPSLNGRKGAGSYRALP